MGEESDLTTGLCYNRFPDEKGTEREFYTPIVETDDELQPFPR